MKRSFMRKVIWSPFPLSSAGDFMSTPGIVYEAVRKLAWEEINVNEIVSTMNELTFVIRREDSMAAFSVLQSFLGGQV